MVQFLPIIFFLGFLQFLLGFSKVPVFLCHSVLLSCTDGLKFFSFRPWKFRFNHHKSYNVMLCVIQVLQVIENYKTIVAEVNIYIYIYIYLYILLSPIKL